MLVFIEELSSHCVAPVAAERKVMWLLLCMPESLHLCWFTHSSTASGEVPLTTPSLAFGFPTRREEEEGGVPVLSWRTGSVVVFERHNDGGGRGRRPRCG